MARSLKAAPLRSATSSAEVEETAAAIIAAVRTGGDDAVREWSEKLDGWSPPSFLLTDKELSEIVCGCPRRWSRTWNMSRSKSGISRLRTGLVARLRSRSLAWGTSRAAQHPCSRDGRLHTRAGATR